MLIKLKKERTHQEDRRLALWLATSAGLLNAIALGAFGFFPSHMTGNTSQFSSEVSSTDLNDIIFFATIILSFVTGAIIARIIVLWGIMHNVRLIFCQVLFIEGLLLAGVSLYEMFFHTFTTNREIIVFLCGLMGIHNSTSTQLSGGRVRSTHITGTLTDAGISLASVVVAMLRRDYSKDTAAQRSQLKTHLTTLFSFITGGIAGLILFRWFGFHAMLALGLMLVFVATFSIINTSLRVRKVRAAFSK
ncbi:MULTISPECIES: YoaK family protein [unclassified Leclercia]|uniref:YoaK family protein n=1 Tax=unclassified Leclercia TaxID=2627398 RepID=UPI001CE43B14|nr:MULTISPECIES: YoaK family protein [unclassified Leclercia]